MKWGIVGAQADKFTAHSEARARSQILALLRPGDVVITGRCPKGGVDVWAAEIGLQIGLPVIEYPPQSADWEGFKARNKLIAEAYEEGVCITPREVAPGFRGKRAGYCYHCNSADHVVSGGCWTIAYGRRIGKPGRVIVV